MGVKFFGQFLIEIGEIQAVHLREALSLMESRNQSLGEFAISSGVLSEEDVNQIATEQRTQDASFEDLAVRLKILSQDQAGSLLEKFSASRIRIGEALLELGHLPDGKLPELLERFNSDQAEYHNGQVDLPSDLKASRLSQHLIALLPKFVERLSGVQIKVDEGFAASGHSLEPHIAGLDFQANGELQLILAADEEFAARLTAGMLGAPVESVNSFLLDDGLGEFLNVLAGNAVAVLESEDQKATFDPPILGGVKSAERGYVFPLLATHGKATLVLSLN